jgi:hypothetical protein
MRTAQAEIDQQAAGRSEHGSRCLAGHQRLVVEQVHHAAFDELGLA